jgi:nicotinate-nucleotide pyrophosphorylase (carboxylating)
VTTWLNPAVYREIVRRALDEDIGGGDVTSEATIDASQVARGTLIAKCWCVVAGIEVACEVFRQADARVSSAESSGTAGMRGLEVAIRKHDGEQCAPGDVIGEIVGSARALLAGERTALNFLQRLSGVATLARRFVQAAQGRIAVLDTRKTTPTFRILERHAVRAGGAVNHRDGLYDAILIKDNHVRLAGGVGRAVLLARARRPGFPIEVEAQTMDELSEALEAGVETVLVDNMDTEAIHEAVRRARGRARIEISGGVTLERMAELASTGADWVSVGALTHSAPAADISLEIEAV